MNAAHNELDFFFDDELDDFIPVYPAPEESASDPDKPRKKNYIVTFDPKKTYTPAERIDRLMAAMKSTSKVLESTISLCEEMQPIDEVNHHINALQLTNASVYSAETLCSLLEDAGALIRVYEDGTPAAEATNEPIVVTIDGVDYLETPELRPSFWIASEDGKAHLAKLDHDLELRKLFEDQPEYAGIYQLVLGACSNDSGATAQALATLVNDDPRVQNPRRYSGYFVDQLQERSAIEWTGSTWRITPTGSKILL